MNWHVAPFSLGPTVSSLIGWADIQIGGGGYITGAAVHSDGTMVCRVDVYGGYIGKTVPGTRWKQLVTSASMPALYSSTPYTGGGTYELVIDPQNSSNLWMYYSTVSGRTLSTVLKSTNRGVTWTATGFPLTSADSNTADASRETCGQRIAVDPANSNIVYVGDAAALRVTTDGGATWSTVTSVTAPTSDFGVCAIKFDSSSGTSGGATNRILVGSNGNGLYVSTNAGTSFSKISGSPTSIGHGYIDANGIYYFTDNGGGNTLSRLALDNATITSMTCASGVQALCINPSNPALAIPIDGEARIYTGSAAANTGTPTWTSAGAYNCTSTDVPWIAASGAITQTTAAIGDAFWDPLVATSSSNITIGTGTKSFTVSNGLNIAIGDLLRVHNTPTPTNYMIGSVASYSGTTLQISVGSYAPGGYLGTSTGGSGTFSAWTITKDRLWCSFGVGFCYADGIYSGSNQNTWVSQTAGQETLVAQGAVWPPGGQPVLTVEDRGFWYITNSMLNGTAYGSGYGPDYTVTTREGSLVDFAKNNTAFIAGITQYFIGGPGSGNSWGYATDGGQTWNKYTTAVPAAGTGVSGVAAATSSLIAISRTSYGGGGGLYVTSNGGSTWSTATGPPAGGWSNGLFQIMHVLTADYVNVGTLYAYNGGDATGFGLWSSSDGAGATWTHTYTSHISSNDFNYAQLKAVPSNAGHLFFSAGSGNDTGTWTSLATVASSHPNGILFYRSTNAGVSWSSVANVQEVITFALGAPKPGGVGYPTVFIVGWVDKSVIVGQTGSGLTYGIYRSDDNCSTWNKIGDFPPRFAGDAGGWIDAPVCIAADEGNWGQCIVGFQGSGFARYK